jgi:hypothetical protein
MENKPVLRHSSRRWSAGSSALLIAMLGLVLPASDLPLGTKLVAGACLFVAELVFYRALMMSVRADDDALVVTNLLTRRRITWEDIVDFAIRGHGMEAKLLLIRANGDEVVLGGVMPSVFAPDRDATLATTEETLRGWVRSASSRP